MVVLRVVISGLGVPSSTFLSFLELGLSVRCRLIFQVLLDLFIGPMSVLLDGLEKVMVNLMETGDAMFSK